MNELDLHGYKHAEVEDEVENFILSNMFQISSIVSDGTIFSSSSSKSLTEPSGLNFSHK